MFWAGYSDEFSEGFFANVNNGEILHKEDGYWPFFPGEPNGEYLVSQSPKKSQLASPA
jgi:hypothetical protein